MMNVKSVFGVVIMLFCMLVTQLRAEMDDSGTYLPDVKKASASVSTIMMNDKMVIYVDNLLLRFDQDYLNFKIELPTAENNQIDLFQLAEVLPDAILPKLVDQFTSIGDLELLMDENIDSIRSEIFSLFAREVGTEFKGTFDFNWMLVNPIRTIILSVSCIDKPEITGRYVFEERQLFDFTLNGVKLKTYLNIVFALETFMRLEGQGLDNYEFAYELKISPRRPVQVSIPNVCEKASFGLDIIY